MRRLVSRHPVASLWAIAVVLEVAIIAAFLTTGAQAAVERALQETGIGFNTDLITALRVVVEAPYAALGVALSIAQVASPDIALLLVVWTGAGTAALVAVKRRWRPWSREVPWQRGLRVWATVVVVFSAMNVASAGLHRLTLHDAGFEYSLPTLSLDFALAFLVAMFLDAGAVFEESAWRGFALPLLQARYAPVLASTILGLLWSAWHVPVKFDLALLYGPAGFAGMFVVLTVKFVVLSLVMAHFCNRVGISVPLAIVMHGLSNDSVRLGGFVDTDAYSDVLLSEVNLILPMAVVAAVLVWRTRGRLGLAAEPAAPRVARAAGSATGAGR